MSVFRSPARRILRAVSLLIVSIGLLWASAAAATVMLYADLARLVELSDVIVQGRVVDQDTFFDEKADEIATITTVEVDHAYLGKVGKTVAFRQWGGNHGELMAKIPGDAHFEPYEEVVLFLADGKGQYAGMRYLVALGQSKYTVFRANGNALVTRDLHDLAFLDQSRNEISARPSEHYELRNFVPELEALIAAIKGDAR